MRPADGTARAAPLPAGRPPVLRLAAALLLAAAAPAAAHGTLEGVHRFYAGLLHPLLVPAQAMLVLGLGLVLAQAGRAAAPRTLAAWLLGLGLGLAALGLGRGPEQLTKGVLAVACGLGLLAAASAPLAAGALALLGLAAGLALGLDSEPGPAPPAERWMQLAGTGLAATALLVLVAGALVGRARPWQRLAIRVAGSWIAAAALMVLALGLRG